MLCSPELKKKRKTLKCLFMNEVYISFLEGSVKVNFTMGYLVKHSECFYEGFFLKMKLIFKPVDGAKQLALRNVVELCILEATYSGSVTPSPLPRGLKSC